MSVLFTWWLEPFSSPGPEAVSLADKKNDSNLEGANGWHHRPSPPAIPHPPSPPQSSEAEVLSVAEVSVAAELAPGVDCNNAQSAKAVSLLPVVRRRFEPMSHTAGDSGGVAGTSSSDVVPSATDRLAVVPHSDLAVTGVANVWHMSDK